MALDLIFDSHPNTPEEVFKQYYDKINNGDLDGALNLTLMKFATEENRTQQANNLHTWISQAEYQNVVTFHKDNMTENMTKEAERYIETYIDNYSHFYITNVSVEDYCIVHSTVIIETPEGETITKTRDTIFVLIDSNWYLANSIGVF